MWGVLVHVVLVRVVFVAVQVCVRMVEERRGLGHDEALTLADARVFTARQAVANGLIDALGGEVEARQWLDDVHHVDSSVPVRDVEIGRPEDRIRDLIGGLVGKAIFSERLRLDGLISLWHPEL